MEAITFTLIPVTAVQWKAGAAMFKGMVILMLGVGAIINALLKIGSGVPPSSALMLLFGVHALTANLLCLVLLRRFRRHDLKMASALECSRNDVIANVGVLMPPGWWYSRHLPGRIFWSAGPSP